MRIATALLLVLTAVVVDAARAGDPDQANSFCGISSPTVPCTYRFLVNGALDHLLVSVVLEDAAGERVGDWPVTATLVPNANTLAFCTCCPNPQTGVTSPAINGGGGGTSFLFRQIGGRGSLDVLVDAGTASWSFTIPFTSSDMNGSCETVGSATTVIDLGLWAAFQQPWSDYDCNGLVNIVDLGIWASGLQKACNTMCP